MDTNKETTQPPWAKLTAGSLAVIGFIWLYGLYHSYFPTTDNAYLHANVVKVAPEVTGQIKSLPVHEYQFVKKGQLLLEINPEPYQIALRHAVAQYQVLQHKIAASNNRVLAARAQIEQANAKANLAKKNATRARSLAGQERLPKSAEDAANAESAMAQATLRAAQAEYTALNQEIGSEEAQKSQLAVAEAAVAKAKLDLKNTEIYALYDGWIANITSRAGDLAITGQPLLALIEKDSWWIEANYKETELLRIQPGQPVKISIDLYPSLALRGHVDHISYGSGAAFSILPPENATGNWVKVTQRFPVKISLDPLQNDKHPLRVGASCHVSINTV